MSPFEMDTSLCRGRQQRLIEQVQRLGADLAIVTRIEHVQWLTGVRFGWTFEPAAALSVDGHCILVSPARKPPQVAAADEIVTYHAQWTSTLRNDQRQASSEALLKALDSRPRPLAVAVEFSCFSQHLSARLPEKLVDLEPALLYLRRRKDRDELALIRQALAASARMYELARRIVQPGVNELEVFSRLQQAAVEECGEMLTGTGNDYACNARGGPPRDRRAQEGELYILDLGPAFCGYFADTCRTLAVGGNPTDAQLRAWEKIAEVFPVVESIVRPGLSCRAFYLQIKQMMDDYLPGVFDHHLGHGIGLFPHEAPHLNPNWDDVFEVGDVFTVEPGLYSPELRAGIRLENDYLVTSRGVELLSDFPLGL
jgi:Xaa-Pro aminopeptidase